MLEIGMPKVFANKQLMALPTHDEILNGVKPQCGNCRRRFAQLVRILTKAAQMGGMTCQGVKSAGGATQGECEDQSGQLIALVLGGRDFSTAKPRFANVGLLED
jgi:hypothetical protein